MASQPTVVKPDENAEKVIRHTLFVVYPHMGTNSISISYKTPEDILQSHEDPGQFFSFQTVQYPNDLCF